MAQRRILLFLVAVPWILLATIPVPTSAQMKAAEGLSGRLEAVKPQYGRTEAKQLRFTLTNTAGESLHVLKWQTPLEGFTADILEVKRDGQPVRYIGRQVKRAAPSERDYVLILPGKSISATVNVAAAYDVSAPGEYTVAVATRVFDVARGDTPKLAKTTADLSVRTLTSNAVSFRVAAAPGEAEVPPVTPFDAEPKGPVTPGRLTDELRKQGAQKAPAFVSCSSTRQDQLNTALAYATLMAVLSDSCLHNQTAATIPQCTRYTKWFGAYDASRLSTVTTNFDGIGAALKDQQITFHCDCTDSSYAYVYPGNPYHVWLCNAFWSAPDTGTDSRAGTIIHEVSHFYAVASTKDYAYGQAACQNLAINDPSKAVKNADSQEYFAENTPAEKCKCGAEHLVLTLPLLFALVVGSRLRHRPGKGES